MNKNNALNIKNWNQGGNNYVLKGNPKNKWVGFQQTVIDTLISKFGNKFNTVIWTDPLVEDDYYCIPFASIEHLFTEQNKTTGKYTNRWTSVIKNHIFLMHSNSELSVDISKYYSPKKVLDEEDEDYFIENAKAELSIRIGQSKFRKDVLKNFNYKCALSNITEQELLIASHIIPWSHKKEFRGDISNGICLYTEYDIFFDKGFITFSDSLEVIITSQIKGLSRALCEKLLIIQGKKLSTPKKQLKNEYLRYHRDNIFKK
jgi:predicted restriction endonuclease